MNECYFLQIHKLKFAILLKVKLLHEGFLSFLNCTNDNKSRKASHNNCLIRETFTPLNKSLHVAGMGCQLCRR